MKTLSKAAIGIGLAGALAVATLVPASAAPAFSNKAMVQSATGQVTDVRWRGGAVAAGVLGGLALGGAIASAPYYYGSPYYGYYAPPRVYGYDYGYAPRYLAPSYNYGDSLHNGSGNF